LCSDLGFSREDRCENLRRVGEMAKLLLEAGIIVLAAFISPFEVDRQRIHDMIGEDDFIEIYCRCPLQVCEQRDVKGHYSRARKGKIEEFTGISSPYEEPLHPKLILDTAELSLNQCVEDLLSLLRNLGIVRIV
jgi:adenylylsulfate kinase